MTSLSLQVDVGAGAGPDAEPLRFLLGGKWRDVESVLDRWYDARRQYFKVRADDGGIYMLCHEFHSGWFLYMYDSNTRPETRLSST